MGVRIEFHGKSGSGKTLLQEHIRAGLRSMGLSVSIPFEGREYAHAMDVAGAPGATIAETIFPGTADKPAPEHLKPAQARAWRASRRGAKALDRACKRVMDNARLIAAVEAPGWRFASECPFDPKPEPFQPTNWPRLTLYGRWLWPGKDGYSGYSTTTFEHGVSFVVVGGDCITVYTVQGHKFEAARTDASESAYRAWNECKR